MYQRFKKLPQRFLSVGIILGLVLSATVTLAATPSSLTSLFRSTPVVVNSSFISPLVELFGNVAVGKRVFVASNTVLRADPDTHICIGNETNLQDNILFIARRRTPAPTSACGRRSSSTGNQVSIAHQASIENSKIGSFTFIGF